jgi:CheY-like chemotaxis protein
LPGGVIDLTVSAEGAQAIISVRDNGIGMKAEVLPQVFDLYVQESPSSESGRRGLGVGLALARQLVELHEGTIEATSPGRGQGSEFTIHLAQAPSDAPEIPPQANHLNGAAELAPAHRILVIDDQPDIADSLATLLKLSNNEVWAAYDGLSGIAVALEHHPDVVLIDIAIPEMDGYEVARQLRERHPEALLIAVSGLAQEADRVHAHEAGFDHHVAKPATIKQLDELIAKRIVSRAAK